MNRVKLLKILHCSQIVACVLISVAVYGKASAQITNVPIIGGILACGVFLILISLLGLYGAAKHHQVVLFFVSFYLKPTISMNQVLNLISVHDCFVPVVLDSIQHSLCLPGGKQNTTSTNCRAGLAIHERKVESQCTRNF